MISYFLIFFILGLQSTLHCVGMCGPLAFAAPIQKRSISTAVFGSLSYNFGRISSYSYLGFVIGLLGIRNWFIHTAQWLSILTGLIMMVSVFIGSIETWPLIRYFSAWVGRNISQLFPKIRKAPNFSQSYLFGLINGFLPCGMVYIALIYTMGAPDYLSALIGMFFFGIGTLPVMFFMPLIGQKKLLAHLPRNTHKILLFIIAALLIIRGLGLGIPYLSPLIKVPTKAHQQPSIECCEVQ
jgi:sulfite exporter TauE/SafE